jgi:hypothetical protein
VDQLGSMHGSHVSSQRVVDRARRVSRGRLLELVLDLEGRLRALIETTFSRRSAASERLIPQSIREELESRRGKGILEIGGPVRSKDLLSFASLGELAGILSARWKFFEAVFVDKTLTLARLEETRLFRNALAHGEELNVDDKAKLLLLIRDLSERIPHVYSARRTEVSTEQRLPRPGHGLRGSDSPSRAPRARWVRDVLDQLDSSQTVSLIPTGEGTRAVRTMSVKKAGRTVGRIVVGQTSLVLLTLADRTWRPSASAFRASHAPGFLLAVETLGRRESSA